MRKCKNKINSIRNMYVPDIRPENKFVLCKTTKKKLNIVRNFAVLKNYI